MTIPAERIKTALAPPSPRMQFVTFPQKGDKDAQPGLLSGPGIQFLQQLYRNLNGLVPTVACNAVGTNIITLTPVNISPLIEDYVDYLAVAFVAENTTLNVTSAFLSLPTGDLETLPVFIDNGASPAIGGEIVQDLFYTMYYVSSIGGWVLK